MLLMGRGLAGSQAHNTWDPCSYYKRELEMCAITPPAYVSVPSRSQIKTSKEGENNTARRRDLHKDKMSMLCLHVELVSVNLAGGQYVE